jgi:hypothetical protein
MTTITRMSDPPAIVETPPLVSWRRLGFALIGAHGLVLVLATVLIGPPTYVPIEWSHLAKDIAWALMVVESDRTWLAVGIACDVIALVLLHRIRLGTEGRILRVYLATFVIAVSLQVIAFAFLTRHPSIQFSGFNRREVMGFRAFRWSDLPSRLMEIALLFAPLLILACALSRRFVLVSRIRRRICPFCRYDLRASPGGRCPECGRSNGELPFLRPRQTRVKPIKS